MDNLTWPPLLTADDEVELARRIEAGVLAADLLASGAHLMPASDAELAQLVADGDRAWKHFLLANLRLVRKLAAREARCSGLAMDDLFQEGFLALAGALQRFDSRRGRFSTYATSRISQHLAQVSANRLGELGLTIGRALLVRRAHAMSSALSQASAGTADPADVAAGLGLSTTVTRDLLGYRGPASLDLLDQWPSLSESAPIEMEQRVYAEQVRRTIARLAPAEATVISLRFGLGNGEPLDASAVARRLGVSSSTVRRIEKRALASLRTVVGRLDPSREWTPGPCPLVG